MVFSMTCSGDQNLFSEKKSSTDKDSFYLENVQTGFCLEPEDSRAYQTSHLIYGSVCKGDPTDAQKALLTKEFVGSDKVEFYLKSVQTGNCIHVVERSAHPGARVQFFHGCAEDKNVFKKEYTGAMPSNPNPPTSGDPTSGGPTSVSDGASGGPSDSAANGNVISDGGGNELPAIDSEDPPFYVYKKGPQVSNVYKPLCSHWKGDFTDAQNRCSVYTNCSVLHNEDCDGNTWRYCFGVWQDLVGEDSLACTMITVPYVTTDKPRTPKSNGEVRTVNFSAMFSVALIALIVGAWAVCCRQKVEVKVVVEEGLEQDYVSDVSADEKRERETGTEIFEEEHEPTDTGKEAGSAAHPVAQDEEETSGEEEYTEEEYTEEEYT
jgi:hypothetical protein